MMVVPMAVVIIILKASKIVGIASRMIATKAIAVMEVEVTVEEGVAVVAIEAIVAR